jgi:hypothetical protein
MFSHWISGWESKGGKRFRRVSLKLEGDKASIVTVIVGEHISSDQLSEIENFFESGPEHSQFRFRGGVVDPDPADATLMEVSVGDLVVDLDVFHPGIDPGAGVYIGMAANEDSGSGTTA